MSKLIIAYAAENQYVASKIASALTTQITVEHIRFDNVNNMQTLDKTAAAFPDSKVLLLISDNFLKSENCMTNALSVVQNLGNAKRLIPVTTDGIYDGGGTGEKVKVPTSFDRVSNVIQYMNHWQDRYLELRRLKPDGDESVFNEKMRNVRSISSEVGEMLRFLRAMEFFSFDQFEESNFLFLYRILGLNEQGRAAKEVSPNIAVEKTVAVQAPTISTQPSAAFSTPIEPVANGVSYKPPVVETPSVSNQTTRDIFITDIKEEVKEEIKAVPPPVIEPVVEKVPPPPINTAAIDSLIDTIKREHESEQVKTQSVEQVLNDIVHENDAATDAVLEKTSATFEDIQNIFNEAPLQEEPKTLPLHDDVDEIAVREQITKLLDESENADAAFEFETTEKIKQEIAQAKNEAAQTTESLERLQKYYEAVEREPLSSRYRYDFAAQLAQMGKLSEASEQLDILLENDRTNTDGYILLAFIAEQLNDNLLAINCLEKVTLLRPDYPGIFYKLGDLTERHYPAQKRKIYRYFREAVSHDPRNADAHFRFALLEKSLTGNLEDAKKHLEKALEFDPNHGQAAFALAKMYVKDGEQKTAFQLYTKAIAVMPSLQNDENDAYFYYEEPRVMNNDNGITVLITGATSGIGKATAEVFAQNGYRLILTGRRTDRLENIKTEFEDNYRNKIQLLTFDVRDLKSVKKAVSELEEEFKNVDILINNAGLASGLAPIHEGDIEDWEIMIDTNIKGLLYMTRAIAPQMVARKKGHIINICSTAGKEIYPQGNVYIATKHAVDALTRAMRVDLHRHGIRVSQVAPGHVEETEFALVRFHGDAEKAKIYNDFQPLKAKDVAESIYYIVTRPEYVNIQDLVLMGTQQAGSNFIDRSGRKEN